MPVRELVEYLITVSTDTKQAKGGFAALATEAKAAAAGIGAVAAGFAAAGAGAVALANDLTDAVDRINTLATNSGLAAETIKGLDALAASTGKDLANLVPKDLPKRIKEAADGVGPAAKGFETLGLSATDASGNLKSADQVIRETIDALGQIEDPTLKAAAAQQMFGARAQELTSALADSGDLDAWVGYADRFGTDVGPEAVRITAKWQQSMAIFNQGVLAMKSGLLPLVDILANTVTGLTAMAIFATNAAGALARLRNPFQVLRAGFDGVADWASGVRDLNAELGRTSTRLDDAAQAAAKLSGIFENGDPATNALLIGFTGGNRPKAGGDDPPKGGKKREPEEDVPGVDGAELRRLEAQAQAHGEELAQARRDQQTKAQEAMDRIAQTLLDGMSSFEVAVADVVASESDTMQDGFSALSLAMGSVVDLAGIVGGAASMVEDVTTAIETLPEQLLALPESVSGLVDALGGLVPALIEASPEIALAVADAVVSLMFANVEIIGQALGALFEALPGDIAAAIADALKGLGGQLNPFDGDGQFLGGIAERIPFFEEGGVVNRTGLAVVHAGEAVVPAMDTGTAQASMATGARSGAVVHVHTTDARVAAREVSAAIGPYGLGVALGGVR